MKNVFKKANGFMMLEFSISLSILTFVVTGLSVLLLFLSYQNGMRAGIFKAARKGMVTVGSTNREIDVLNTRDQYFSFKSLFKSGSYLFSYTSYNNLTDKLNGTTPTALDLGAVNEVVTYEINANLDSISDYPLLPKIRSSERITVFNEAN